MLYFVQMIAGKGDTSRQVLCTVHVEAKYELLFLLLNLSFTRFIITEWWVAQACHLTTVL